MLVDNFFTDTFDFEKEKLSVLEYVLMKKNQDPSEAVFYEKYLEIQDCIGEQFKISDLKNKLWNDTDISN